MSSNLFRELPSVNDLLLESADLVQREGHARTVAALRSVLDAARADLRSGVDLPVRSVLLARTRERLAPALRSGVINATGVVLHTNLGRAPLSAAAQRALVSAAAAYTPLEFDMRSGERGRRGAALEDVLCETTGAQAALVVNNCAAATVLMLAAHAAGRGVVVARGQLVEIGGGFRVPEIMRQSGARLIEVGTTNRVRAADYAQALQENADVAALLRVHASNFKMIGFVEEVDVAGLAAVAHAGSGVVVLDDLGSGALIDTAQFGLAHEPMPQESLRAGADLVAFSGDKLLGGPQAGVLLGTRDAVERCRRHPLARAFRADKFTLAALEATLLHYVRGEAVREVPVLRMIAAPLAEIQARTEAVQRALAAWSEAHGVRMEIVDAQSTIGGGSLPGETLPTRALALASASSAALQVELRTCGVIARIHDGRVLLDLRTVLDDEELVKSIVDSDSR
ncbi:MAG: L-seryl-tRNA(Sec) selenium transferase [Chloroflexi bacterium]|nr:L-seryl-tRNA(Sec) selenium transferase [Chloroflexota bacterium]